MAILKLQGNLINTINDLPEAGSAAKDFCLTDNKLQDHHLSDFIGKKVLLNIYPSIDTGICAMSVRKFNEEASKLPNVAVLGISRDLPFALGRFCGAEGIEKLITLSELRSRDFGRDYGLEIINGPMAGLLARAVIIIDEAGKIAYTELVEDIVMEPNYQAALLKLQ
jgi:thiol peroxidase